MVYKSTASGGIRTRCLVTGINLFCTLWEHIKAAAVGYFLAGPGSSLPQRTSARTNSGTLRCHRKYVDIATPFSLHHCDTVCPLFRQASTPCSTPPTADCDLPLGVLVPFCTPPYTMMESDVLHDAFMHYPRLHYIFASPTASFQPADSFDAHVSLR